jgi:hypothetical protein
MMGFETRYTFFGKIHVPGRKLQEGKTEVLRRPLRIGMESGAISKPTDSILIFRDEEDDTLKLTRSTTKPNQVSRTYTEDEIKKTPIQRTYLRGLAKKQITSREE